MRVVMAAALLLSTPVLAEELAKDLKSEVERCASYEGDGDRLACFDFVSGRKPVSSPKDRVVDNSATTGLWRVSEDKSKLDGSASNFAMLSATSAEKASSYGSVNAILVIRCVEKKTSSYVTFGETPVAYDLVEVNYRIDENKPKKELWYSSEDSKAYGLFSQKGNMPFLKSLLGSKEFYIRAQAKIHGSSEAMFNTAGIDAALAGVRKNCGW